MMLNMADVNLWVVATIVTAIPTLRAMAPPRVATPQASPPPDELYSESPCELRPLSAWKDPQGNVWGVGEGSLWWFNATNLSWSLLPLPNGSSSNSVSSSWRVTCGDPRRYVALQSAQGSLVLHLPWQHWQQVDTDEVHAAMDSEASWCDAGTLYATDVTRGALYILDQEEARWVLHAEVRAPTDLNGTRPGSHSLTWLRADGQFVLLEQKETCTHLVSINASGAMWTMLAKRGSIPWPHVDEHTITWAQGGDRLWVWKIAEGEDRLWMFNMSDSTWQQMMHGESSGPPPLTDLLTSWVEGDRFCALMRSRTCSAQYSPSSTWCWTESEVIFEQIPSLPYNSTATVATTKLLSVNQTQVISPPPTLHVASPPSPASSASHVVSANWHSRLSVLKPQGIEDVFPSSSRDTPITAVVPAANPPWHQQHSSVFGSVIFFGTSLTIFGVVGIFWCIRRCVHFPKEALLLRDPPSVRYTAIPDSVMYDSRGQPSTYAVIPDSVA